MPGRLTGKGAGPALAATDVALGAGFGSTASCTISGNDQRGQIVVTSAGTGQAQATATVTVTFKRKFADAPVVIVVPVANTSVATGENVIDITQATTGFSFKAGVLPVATKVYTYNYFCIG